MPTPLTLQPAYFSGDFSSPRKISQTPPEYPFAHLGDTTSKIYTRSYVVDILKFAPTARGTVDPDVSGCYLVAESLPEIFQGRLAKFTRTYASIPGDKVSYTSQSITKPVVPNQAVAAPTFSRQSGSSDASVALGAGQYYAISGGAYLFSPTNKFYGVLQLGSAPAVTVPNNGTFTLTYKTSTTAALAYNASGATIATALNGLADVIADGLSFTGGVTNNLSATGDLQIVVTTGSTTSRITMNPASLSPSAASKAAFTVVSSGNTQVIYIGALSTVTAHGFDASKPLAQVQSDVATSTATRTVAIADGTTHWSIVDANTIAIDRSIYAMGSTCYFGNYLRDYTPGVDRLGLKLTQKFYLPGVTGGITTGADIPIPNPLLNDTDFLSAVLANLTGYVTYDATQLTFWPSAIAPIYTQTLSAINMADV